MKRALYDTRAGIASQLTSLRGLNQVLEARASARDKDEAKELHEFVLLGRWWLDQYGQVWQSQHDAIIKRFPEISNVLTMTEFRDFWLPQISLNSFVWEMYCTIPPAEITCVECGQAWTIENCFDSYTTNDTQVVPLTEFVGKTLGEVKAYFAAKTDAVYRLQPERTIRNDSHIDLTSDERYPTLAKNEGGWLKKELSNRYVIKPGDEAMVNIWYYYHKACNRAHKEKKYREFYLDAFTRRIRS